MTDTDQIFADAQKRYPRINPKEVATFQDDVYGLLNALYAIREQYPTDIPVEEWDKKVIGRLEELQITAEGIRKSSSLRAF